MLHCHCHNEDSVGFIYSYDSFIRTGLLLLDVAKFHSIAQFGVDA